MLAEPGTKHGEERCRLLEVGGVAGVGDEGERCVVADVCGHASRQRAELLVALAGHDQDGHGQPTELVPRRVLGARASLVQARHEALDAVLEPLRPKRPIGREVSEQRLRQPRIEERLEPVSLQAGRRLQVLGPPGRSLLRVLDASGTADQHEAAHEL